MTASAIEPTTRETLCAAPGAAGGVSPPSAAGSARSAEARQQRGRSGDKRAEPAALVAVDDRRPSRTKQTGPRTPAGQRRSCRNAVKYGLTAKAVTIAGLETERDWQKHRKAWIDDLAPEGQAEAALAERIALQHWRLLRAARYETAEASKRQQEVAREAKAEADAAAEARATVAFAHQAQGALAAVGDLGRAPGEAMSADDAFEALVVVAELLGLDDEHAEVFPWPGLPLGTAAADFAGWTIGMVRSAVAALAALTQWDDSRPAGRAGLPLPRLGEVAPAAEPADWPDRAALEILQSIHAQIDPEDVAPVDPAALLAIAQRTAERKAITASARAMSRLQLHSRLVDAPGLPSDEVLKRLADYEGRAERSLFKTLRELQQMQDRRTPGRAPPPAGRLDITLDDGR